MSSLKRYTGYIEWAETGIEEIDVDAIDYKDAKRLIQKEMDENYEPGGKIIEIKEQFGLYC